MQAPGKGGPSLPSEKLTSLITSRLAIVFVLWKTLLFIFAIASPGPGYDTSTRILLDQYQSGPLVSWLSQSLDRLVCRLTRWDAIYFTSLSHRGHVHEQDWAFSWALTRLTSIVSRGVCASKMVSHHKYCTLSKISVVPLSQAISSPARHALVGILISNASHLLAVFSIYHLTYQIIPSDHDSKRRIAITAALLHIFSPAGLFLSAFYGESPFALFNFLGMLFYAMAVRQTYGVGGSKAAITASLWTMLSSLCFGGATVIRSNGMLSGLIFAWDAIEYLPRLPDILQFRAWPATIKLAGSLISGLLLGIAYIIPQIRAYMDYCFQDSVQPWCLRTLPSIYTWVQEQYWDVGFLRYWTLSNLPLFLLAAPMILLLLATGWLGLQGKQLVEAIGQRRPNKGSSGVKSALSNDEHLYVHVMARFALPQVVLALLATTNFHVQIINRLSSGYPVWYILLAIAIHKIPAGFPRKEVKQKATLAKSLINNSPWIVRAMVMYAIIQGGLYASFLPPA